MLLVGRSLVSRTFLSESAGANATKDERRKVRPRTFNCFQLIHAGCRLTRSFLRDLRSPALIRSAKFFFSVSPCLRGRFWFSDLPISRSFSSLCFFVSFVVRSFWHSRFSR